MSGLSLWRRRNREEEGNCPCPLLSCLHRPPAANPTPHSQPSCSETASLCLYFVEVGFIRLVLPSVPCYLSVRAPATSQLCPKCKRPPPGCPFQARCLWGRFPFQQASLQPGEGQDQHSRSQSLNISGSVPTRSFGLGCGCRRELCYGTYHFNLRKPPDCHLQLGLLFRAAAFAAMLFKGFPPPKQSLTLYQRDAIPSKENDKQMYSQMSHKEKLIKHVYKNNYMLQKDTCKLTFYR